ncbi:MAG: ribonuclease J [bacterium]|nr:ribonuclease J [bacterium]
MDKLDAWMNRLSGDTSGTEPSSQKPQSKGGFHKKSKNKGQKNQGQGQQGQPKRPQPQKGQPQKGQHGKSRSQRSNSYKGQQPTYTKQTVRKPKPTVILKGKLKVIPLGGLNEVGKNMMALEYENDIMIIDMGFEFPSEDLMGIDYVIPDVSYLEDNKNRIRGVVITHGHLDHIGGIPYILPKLGFPPVYGTKLTLGLIKKRTEEFKQEKQTKLLTINPNETIKLGQFACSFFRVAHSIPDAVGVVVDTPVGKVVHTGDFKFDETPARNQPKAETNKMEQLGKQNVLALFCESTNSLKAGHSMSEREVGHALDEVVGKCKGRIIIASFSSQIGRIQQIIDAAQKHNRKIFVSGRSMENNIDISASLGYLNLKKDLVQNIRRYKNSTSDRETLILTTGSQGEAVSALSRMAKGEHAHVKVRKGDTIILSSSPIPGNEIAINTIINNLTILGADIIHNEMKDVHTSGHGKQDELVRMINYVKPKYLVPVHGEYYMRKGLARLAEERCGIPEDRIIMLLNGDVLLAERGKVIKSKEKVDTKYILIDGSGEGQVGSAVQVERQIMAQNGILVVLIYINKKSKKLTKPPDVISRGFIYMSESDAIIKEISKLAEDSYKKILDKNPGANRGDIKKYIRQTVDKITHQKLERRPLIVPLIIES